MNCIIYLARKERWHVIKIRALVMTKSLKFNFIYCLNSHDDRLFILELLNLYVLYLWVYIRLTSEFRFHLWDGSSSVSFAADYCIMTKKKKASNHNRIYFHIVFDVTIYFFYYSDPLLTWCPYLQRACRSSAVFSVSSEATDSSFVRISSTEHF